MRSRIFLPHITRTPAMYSRISAPAFYTYSVPHSRILSTPDGSLFTMCKMWEITRTVSSILHVFTPAFYTDPKISSTLFSWLVSASPCQHQCIYPRLRHGWCYYVCATYHVVNYPWNVYPSFRLPGVSWRMQFNAEQYLGILCTKLPCTENISGNVPVRSYTDKHTKYK